MAQDIKTYAAALETELRELTKELQGVGIHNPDNPHDWIATPEKNGGAEADPNVSADHVEDWDERRGLVATLETRYNNITRALTKISEGTYGTCEVCGKDIEDDRLTANPAARTCKEHLNEGQNLPR